MKLHRVDKFKRIVKKILGAMHLPKYCIKNEHDLKIYLGKNGGIRVLSGPFKGMAYQDKSYGSAWGPKVLGTYECELHSIIDQLQLDAYNYVVDIGCAEGYYVAGLAYIARLKNIAIEIHGYDLNCEAVQAANELCSINNLKAAVHCKRYSLDNVEDDKILFIIDIEGGEFELLDKENVGRLQSCSFIVEVHEPKGSRERLDQLLDAFSSSHHIEVIEAVPRSNKSLESLKLPIARWQQLDIVNEGRIFGNRWLFASTKATPPSIS